MLQIIAGRSGSGKTEMIHRRISQSVEENEVILLVPEQSTFQNEKRLLDTFGAQKAARVQVLSFKRLYDAVTAVYGGYTQKRIDDGAKAVLMSLAAEAVSDRLVLYSGRSKRSDFAEMMLSAVNEFKMCTISPEQLLSAADKTQNQRLRQKLQESAAVYEAYEALLQKAYSDPDDDLTRLHELLLLHPYFEGKVVYIDAFNGFSGQEKKILSCILEQAQTVCVALCCDKSSAGMVSQSIFREPDTTMRWLMAEAQSIGIDTVLMTALYRFMKPRMNMTKCGRPPDKLPNWYGMTVMPIGISRSFSGMLPSIKISSNRNFRSLIFRSFCPIRRS